MTSNPLLSATMFQLILNPIRDWNEYLSAFAKLDKDSSN